jgi:hypothetical protein
MLVGHGHDAHRPNAAALVMPAPLGGSGGVGRATAPGVRGRDQPQGRKVRSAREDPMVSGLSQIWPR